MAKGGARPRSGPIARSAAEQRAVGGKVRARNRVRRTPGTAATADAVPPPPHLTATEREAWDYYAPLLASAGRLTLEARDTLAKYCTALAEIVRLKVEMAAVDEAGRLVYRPVLLSVTVDGAGNEHVTAKPNPLGVQLRQWLMVCRGYEADLLLSPAAAIRVPQAPADEDDTPKVPGKVHDFYGGPRAV